MDVPQARVAVIDGTAHAPGQAWKHGRTTIKTLWGELAWQLGGSDGFALVKESDDNGTSPGKEVLRDLLEPYAPCVVLIDELVAYIGQFAEGKTSQRRDVRQQSVVRAVPDGGRRNSCRTRSCWASLPDSDASSGDRGRWRFGRWETVRPGAGTLEAGGDGGGVRDRPAPAVRADQGPGGPRRGLPGLRRRLHRGRGEAAERDTGGPLPRPAAASVPDPPRGVRPAVRGLDDHRRASSARGACSS